MLILTRRAGEVIRIGDDIHITICDVKGSQVKVGIVADASVPVHRQEIYEMIQREKAQFDEILKAPNIAQQTKHAKPINSSSVVKINVKRKKRSFGEETPRDNVTQLQKRG